MEAFSTRQKNRIIVLKSLGSELGQDLCLRVMLETDEEAGAIPEVRILVNKVAMKNGTCNEDSTDINDSLYLQWFF